MRPGGAWVWLHPNAGGRPSAARDAAVWPECSGGPQRPGGPECSGGLKRVDGP
jgi:hypothetical protein